MNRRIIERSDARLLREDRETTGNKLIIDDHTSSYKERTLGKIWRKKNLADEEYYTGFLNAQLISGLLANDKGEVRIVVLLNNKRNKRDSDFNILVRKERENTR